MQLQNSRTEVHQKELIECNTYTTVKKLPIYSQLILQQSKDSK